MENENTLVFENSIENPLQYEVGEVCRCYFTEIEKNVDEKVSQRIDKCQSFCRVIEKNPEDQKEYTVLMFDGNFTTKRLPGRCLRKVKLVPFTYEQASDKIGEIIESNDAYEGGKVVMSVSVVCDTDGNGDVEVNSISVVDMMNDFHYRKTGAPFCNIVMLKADEAFHTSVE